MARWLGGACSLLRAVAVGQSQQFIGTAPDIWDDNAVIVTLWNTKARVRLQ